MKDQAVKFINAVTLILSEIYELFEVYMPYKEMEDKKYLDQPMFLEMLKGRIDEVYDEKEIDPENP